MSKAFGQGGREAQRLCSQPERVIECVKFCKKAVMGLLGLGGFAEVGFLVLPEVVHVEVAVGFEPVFVGFDGEGSDQS